jgi:DNA repair exonuclease
MGEIMKLIHTGDIHYGMNPDADKPWGKERAADVKNSISVIVSECRKREVDLLLVSGDLFHRQPIMRDIKEVNYLFSTIPDVNVVIVAGNHDRISENSSIHSFPWADNVHYIKTSDISSIFLPDINTEVYGFSYENYEIRENKLAGIKAPDNGRINILLAHGGDLSHVPFDKNELGNAGFSYVALGHIHKPQVLVDNNVVYCGSPEPLDVTETGKHGFYYVEIDDISANVINLDFIPSASVQYISLVINVSTVSTNSELLMSVSEEINRRGVNNIYRIKIRGMRDPDIEFDLSVLQSKLKIAQIIDDSEPQYNFARLCADHPSDMIGFFIQQLHRPESGIIDKKALCYGVNALLHTTEERGQA